MKWFWKIFSLTTKFQESFSNINAGIHKMCVCVVWFMSSSVHFSGLSCEVRANAGNVSYTSTRKSWILVIVGI